MKRFTYEPKSSSAFMASSSNGNTSSTSMPFSTVSFNLKTTSAFSQQDDEGTVSTIKDTHEINSVLLIGASGKTGLKCLVQLAEHASLVYIFCPDIGSLSKYHIRNCEQAIEGDADNERDLERALEISRADVVAVFSGDDDKEEEKPDLRWVPAVPVIPGVNRTGDKDNTEETIEEQQTPPSKPTNKSTAKALVHVLKKEPDFQSTRLVVVDIVCSCEQLKQVNKRTSQKIAVPTLLGGKKPYKTNEMSIEELSSMTKTQEEETEESLSDYSSILERTTIVVPTIKKRASFKRRRSSLPFIIPKPPLPFGFNRNKSSGNNGNQAMNEIAEEGENERSGFSTQSTASQLPCLADWIVQELLHGEGNEGKLIKLSDMRI